LKQRDDGIPGFLPSRTGLAALVVQLAYGLLIVGFALSRILWLSDILLFFTAASLIIVFSTIASLVQLIADCAAAS
jgi:hypothetical protein